MVARYSTGEKYDEHREAIERIIVETDELRATALRLAEEDEAAFTAVTEAYKLPRDTEEAKAARSAAIAKALVGAGRPPAEVIAVALTVVELAEELLPIGNRNVITDVAAATEAARAAATTARVNVEINLGGIKDEGPAPNWPPRPRRSTTSPPAPSRSPPPSGGRSPHDRRPSGQDRPLRPASRKAATVHHEAAT